MNLDPTPTPFEREMAQMRAGLAADAQAAIAMCIEACGSGAVAYAHWVVIDRMGVAPTVKIPTCRRHDSLGWQPPAPSPSERLTTAPEYQVVTDKDGTRHYPFRFIVSFEALNNYRPQSAERLAAARVKRESAIFARLTDELAMFPEMVPSEAAKIGTPVDHPV